MQLAVGKILNFTQPDEVIDHLKSLDTRTVLVDPKNLKIVSEQGQLLLFMNEGLKPIYPIRRSFLYKLLKWFSISSHSIKHFSDETVIAICNDNLAGIKHRNVKVTVENNEAVTITSPSYTQISDLEVINIAQKVGISEISRDDFCMRIYSKQITESEPVLNDICGYGYNIVNSETGFSPVKMEHFILRYWCTNGATAPISRQNKVYYHYKNNKHSIFSSIEESLTSAPESRERFSVKLKESTDLNAKVQFPSITFQVNSILGSRDGYMFFNNYNMNSSKYDLFNHITDSAKGFNILKRYQLEQLAGKLILN